MRQVVILGSTGSIGLGPTLAALAADNQLRHLQDVSAIEDDARQVAKSLVVESK